ncbi:agouti-signaling protein isoform X2 [Pelodiscus sinensis]|nr:agouti-signaling protein isoform X2 [Pelodiscus sinensis]|eukprot:XP_006131768.1 agouti-signaling protein isoform X2 [Pelodiscus sinensis]
MEDKSLFLALFLCCILLSTTYSHLAFEEHRDTNLATSNRMKLPDLPPISIVELTKTSRKVSRKEAEKKKASKRKTQRRKSRKPRPTHPGNCVATWENCKPPSPPCCDFCTFCHCRLFQTVCYCRVGNRNC